MRILSFTGLLFGSLAFAACGGATPEARSEPAVLTAAPPTASASATTTAAAAPPAPLPITTPEQAARAFVDAIAKHDAAAAVRASDDGFGRGQTRAYADVTDATLDGTASADEWPGIEDLHAALFWATFTTATHGERVLLAVDRETNRVIGLRDRAMRDRIAAERRAQAAKPVEAKGKLLTKPTAGMVKVELAASGPAVGDKVELSRQVDPSIPFIGGSWIVIADTEVAAVVGKVVTLKILAQKSEMKINGKPLDHYTVGVPITLEWTATPKP